MIVRQSCSWCHYVNQLTGGAVYCSHCEHRVDVPRMDCDCPRCETPRRRMAEVRATAVQLAKLTVDLFNSRCPVGTTVIYTDDLGQPQERVTRTPAWLLGDLTTGLVSFCGFAGGYDLSRVRMKADLIPTPALTEESRQLVLLGLALLGLDRPGFEVATREASRAFAGEAMYDSFRASNQTEGGVA